MANTAKVKTGQVDVFVLAPSFLRPFVCQQGRTVLLMTFHGGA